jgi:hypothetical protein
MVKSFFKRMVEEKGLLDEELFIWDDNGNLHIMEVERLIALIEVAPEQEKSEIKKKFSTIDFNNGNLRHYLIFLSKAYIQTNFQHI